MRTEETTPNRSFDVLRGIHATCLLLLALVHPAHADPAVLFDAINHPAQWQQSPLLGNWKTVSASPRIVSLKETEPIFGYQPKRVIVYYKDGQPSQAIIVYMETGYNLNLFKKVDDTQRAGYNAAFDGLKTELPRHLEQLTGQKGQPATLTADAGNFTFDVLDYSYAGLVLRLYVEDHKTICLTVCRPQDASTNLLQISSPEARRATIASNVEHLANGDVSIKNLPVLDQDGRPYCGPAVWTEIARYYGLNLYQEMMLSTGRDGGKGVKEAAHVGKTYETTFDFDKVQKSIDGGNPIWFSAPGHVALITGYNKNQNAILRTDSWGEGSRNKRESLDKFVKEAKAFMYFEP